MQSDYSIIKNGDTTSVILKVVRPENRGPKMGLLTVNESSQASISNTDLAETRRTSCTPWFSAEMTGDLLSPSWISRTFSWICTPRAYVIAVVCDLLRAELMRLNGPFVSRGTKATKRGRPSGISMALKRFIN